VLDEFNVPVTISDMDEDLNISADGEDDDADGSLLVPVKFWGEYPKACNELQPGIKLGMSCALGEAEDQPIVGSSKTAKKPDEGKRRVCSNFTLMRRLGLIYVTSEENVVSTRAYLSHSQP